MAANPGAGGYLAEVKDLTGKPITQKQVTNVITSITFELVPGSYQLRMTTLNRLLEPESATDWIPIHVPAAGPPTVGSVFPFMEEVLQSARKLVRVKRRKSC